MTPKQNAEKRRGLFESGYALGTAAMFSDDPGRDHAEYLEDADFLAGWKAAQAAAAATLLHFARGRDIAPDLIRVLRKARFLDSNNRAARC